MKKFFPKTSQCSKVCPPVDFKEIDDCFWWRVSQFLNFFHPAGARDTQGLLLTHRVTKVWFHGLSWFLAGFQGFSRWFHGSHGFGLVSMVFQGGFMVYHGFGLVSLVFQGGHGFSRFWVGFHGFSKWFHGFWLVYMVFQGSFMVFHG